MSIAPLDMKISLQNSSNVSQSTSQQSQKLVALNNQIVEKNIKESKNIDKKILNTNKTESQTVNKDGRGNNPHGRDKKKKEENKEESSFDAII
jgi:hypothetical protein